METSVDRDDLAGGFAQTLTYEEEVGFRLISRRDRCLGKGTICIELRQFCLLYTSNSIFAMLLRFASFTVFRSQMS